MNIALAGYWLSGLTALVGCLAAVVMFALLRVVAAAAATVGPSILRWYLGRL